MAVAIPLSFQFIPIKNRTHTISLEAEKYSYTPSRIVVNKGDTIVLKPTSADVTHGFLLDGYPVEFITRSGVAFLKYTWEGENGKLQADWDRVDEVEFVVDKAGKFTYRCTQTCGNLHPFISGDFFTCFQSSQPPGRSSGERPDHDAAVSIYPGSHRYFCLDCLQPACLDGQLQLYSVCIV